MSVVVDSVMKSFCLILHQIGLTSRSAYFNIIIIDTLQGEICITKASDIMTRNIVAARANTTAREIGTKLIIGNFNGLSVVDNNIKPIGIVTAIDIFQAIRQGKNLDSLRAIDIMTKNPVTVKQDTDTNEVIDIILQRHIILVPVIDDNYKLIGLIGRPDLLKQSLNQKFATIKRND
jgi:CBS domain-containing protein